MPPRRRAPLRDGRARRRPRARDRRRHRGDGPPRARGHARPARSASRRRARSTTARSTGEPTPTLTAAAGRARRHRRALGATGAGVLQVVSDFPDVDDEMDDAAGDDARRRAARCRSRCRSAAPAIRVPARRSTASSSANADGLEMRAPGRAPRPIGVLLGLAGHAQPVLRRAQRRSSDRWRPISPTARRPSAGSCAESVLDDAELGAPRRPLERVFELGDPPDYEPAPERQRSPPAPPRDGRRPAELVVRPAARRRRPGAAVPAVLNYFDGNLDAAAEMLAHPTRVPGPRRRRRPRRHDLRRQLPDHAAHALGPRPRPRADVRRCRASCSGSAATPRETVGLLDRGVLAPGLQGRPQRHRLRAARTPRRRARRTTCPPAASACCRTPTATCTRS